MPDSLPALSISPETGIALLTAADQAAIHDYALAEKSAATRRAYRSDFAIFTAWCAGRALNQIPAAAQTVAAFIADQANAGFRASTLGRRVAASAFAHALAGLEPPTSSKAVRVVLGGARRKIGTRPTQNAPRPIGSPPCSPQSSTPSPASGTARCWPWALPERSAVPS